MNKNFVDVNKTEWRVEVFLKGEIRFVSDPLACPNEEDWGSK